ncbi:uncharacterized protein LOC135193459 [Vanessa tameamea]|uniref:Uncharacterized protein LOC135193459 n=1 Tax=Vanessa tameamea TaxID=334116 RepID=A0ABM4AL92_VANTA
MDTAYINIKFTPFIKSIVKCESRYNLEIVPITSCVENIEKLEWKDVKDKIEFTIPIVYKIIIMKQNYPKNRTKVYHSCVDIISSSSLTNIKLRHTSEYSVLSKPNECLDANKTKHGMVLNPKLKQKNDIHFYLSNSNYPFKSLKVLKSAVTLLTHGNLKTSKQDINYEVLSHDFKSSEFINSGERIKTTVNKNCNANQFLTNKIKHLDSSDTGDVAIQKNEIKKKILRTPVYNTIGDNSILSKNTASLFNDRLHNLHDCIFNYRSYHQNQIKKNTNLEVNYLNLFSSKSLMSNVRILPEVRVANFVQNMEREILPLKIILNDIINKCVSLNFYTLLQNRSTFDNNIASKGCDVKNCLKSNRVVYSVVFNE